MKVLLLTCSLFLPLAATAADIAKSELTLSDYVESDSTDTLSVIFRTKNKKETRQSCKTFTQSVTRSLGPFGTGLTSQVSCYAGKSRISGLKNKPEKDWVLLIKASSKGLLRITLYAPNKKKVSNLIFRGGKKWLTIFTDPRFSDLVALSLFDKTSFWARTIGETSKPEQIIHSGRALRDPTLNIEFSENEEIQPPEKLVFYTLSGPFPGGPFASEILAIPSKEVVEEGFGERQTKKQTEKRYRWVVDSRSDFKKRNIEVFVHTEQGPGGLFAKIQKQLKIYELRAKNGTLFKAKKVEERSYLAETFGAGYFGIRHGWQIKKEDPLLKDAVSYGILGEFRTGVLEGLRIYYDLIPEVKHTERDLETHLSSSRLVVGTAFLFDLGVSFLRFDLVPKLGLWSFESVLPTTYDNDGVAEQVASFSLAKKFSGGGEIGMETDLNFLLIRAWYGIDVAFSLFGLLGTQSVTSNRYGLDLQTALGPGIQAWEGSPNFRFGLKIYGYFEDITLEDSSKDPPAEGVTVIRGVNLEQTFVGMGIGVSW